MSHIRFCTRLVNVNSQRSILEAHLHAYALYAGSFPSRFAPRFRPPGTDGWRGRIDGRLDLDGRTAGFGRLDGRMDGRRGGPDPDV